MKNEKLGLLPVILIAILMASMSFVTGCGDSEPDKTTTPAIKETGEATTTPTIREVKTLKIGAIMWLGWGLGIDSKQGMELSVELINNSGGLTIGDEKYMIELIVYDDNNTDATARSALNKLIYEDEVKFVISGSNYETSLLATAEANKVIMIGSSTADDILSPDLTYCFRGNPGACFQTVLPVWMLQHFPEKDDWVITADDTQSGHQSVAFTEKILTALGANLEAIYIPSGATDVSAMATKVATLNPDVFFSGRGVETTALDFKAVYQAGYRGQIFMTGAHSIEVMLMMVTPEVLEGLIKGEDPLHLDPPPTQIAADFKEAWIAKYGEWYNPALYYHINFTCLEAALKAAGSIDVDDVADVLANGLQWDSPSGSFQMIDRPDLENSRTVDCVEDCYPVQVVNGKVELIEKFELADSYDIYHKYHQ